MNYWVISGIILAIGFFICLILILRARWKVTHRDISDYQKGRDKLTFREKKEEPQTFEFDKGNFSIGNIIGGFVVLLVGCSLLPTVADTVLQAQNTTNITGTAAGTILSIVPIFFGLAVAASAIGIVASSLRSGGVL